MSSKWDSIYLNTDANTKVFIKIFFCTDVEFDINFSVTKTETHPLSLTFSDWVRADFESYSFSF